MKKTRLVDDALVNSIVGEGTHFRGDLELSGLLRVDGDFSGSIRTQGKVIIGRRGRADCVIHASTIVVGGIFRGEINAADKVVVLSSAVVIGDIYSPRIIAEEGVLLDGSLVIGPKAARPDQRSRGSTVYLRNAFLSDEQESPAMVGARRTGSA